MKAKKFWTIKLLPVNGDKLLHIIDGNGDIVLQVPELTDATFLRAVCDQHNLTHLEDRL